jgi:hypothetical protein
MTTDPSRRLFFKGAMAVTAGAAAVPASLNAQSAEPISYEAFVRLSSVLTGLKDNELPAMADQQDTAGTRKPLYTVYAERVQAAYPAEFAELMSVWRMVQDLPDPEAALSERLSQPGAAAQRLRLAARQVVKIWYLSTIDDPRRALDPEKKGRSDAQLGGDIGQYQQSAIWKLLGAPVPGYSNSPHGYWAKPPSV